MLALAARDFLISGIMQKTKLKLLPSRATRRKVSHTFREFLRGAGTGAKQRGSKHMSRWGVGVLAGVVGAILVPPLTGVIALVAVAALPGIAAYKLVQRSAALAHRVANKGIPEAPNHNRKAQAWGRRVTNAFAVVAFIGTSGVTAGFIAATAALHSEPVRFVPQQKQQRPRHQFETLWIQPAPGSIPAKPVHI